MKKFGTELILDMHGCDVSLFTRESVEKYFNEICELTAMERQGTPKFWFDKSKRPHLRGVSAIQFIKTSNIVIHCLDMLELVLVNFFSCKDFDSKEVEGFTKKFFKAKEVRSMTIIRR